MFQSKGYKRLARHVYEFSKKGEEKKEKKSAPQQAFFQTVFQHESGASKYMQVRSSGRFPQSKVHHVRRAKHERQRHEVRAVNRTFHDAQGIARGVARGAAGCAKPVGGWLLFVARTLRVAPVRRGK